MALERIGESAFFGCINLEKIFIPKSVQYIGRNAFKNCPKLTIYCEADKQPNTWDKDWNPDNRTVVWGVKKGTEDKIK